MNRNANYHIILNMHVNYIIIQSLCLSTGLVKYLFMLCLGNILLH